MLRSVWDYTLAELRDDLKGTAPVPAGVSLAAASAALALGLLIKTLEIASKKQGVRPEELIREAESLSSRLADLADKDAAAFEEYLVCLRASKASGSSGGRERAMLATIEIPMEAASCAAQGIALCVKAVEWVHAFVAPDLGAAAALLDGSVRAILISTDYNLRHVKDERLLASRQEIEAEARRHAEVVLRRLAVQP